MNHAIAILEERECQLRSLIRACEENSDRCAVGIDTRHHRANLYDVRLALWSLRNAAKVVGVIDPIPSADTPSSPPAKREE